MDLILEVSLDFCIFINLLLYAFCCMTLTTSKKAEPSSTEVGFSDDHD